MKMIKKITAKGIMTLSVTCLLLVGCKDNFTSPTSPTGPTITSVASTTDSLKVFYAALNKIGESSSFNNVNSGYFTVFAPSNYAFVKYLRSIGVPNASAFTTDSAVKYISTKVTASSTPLSLTGANSTKSLAGNINYGVISGVLNTSQILGAQGFTTLQGARLSLSNVSGATYPYQINADVASSGGSSGSNIIVSNLTASNGIIQIVDQVMPPISIGSIWDKSLLNFTINYGVSPYAVTMTSGSNTVTIARDSQKNFNVSNAPTDGVATNFNLFSAAVIRSKIDTVLNPNGATYIPDFTAFVPNDAAVITYLNVANEAAGLTAINAMTPTDLQKLVSYHIVAGRILSTDLTNNKSLTTLLSGKAITINVSGATYTISDLNGTSSDATISGANKLSNAGIVHVINGVLLSQ